MENICAKSLTVNNVPEVGDRLSQSSYFSVVDV